MCFVPQRRARFRHRSFQRWSKRGVLPFWPPTVLRATTVCTFRHLNFQKCSGAKALDIHTAKIARTWGVLTFWLPDLLRACNLSSLISPDGSASAALASLLFDPPEPQNIGNLKNTVFWCVLTLFYLFAHLDLLSSLIFFLHLSSAFLFSDSSHLCFSICPYCWKLDF